MACALKPNCVNVTLGTTVLTVATSHVTHLIRALVSVFKPEMPLI